MSFDHSCPAEWPISKRKNTVFLAFFGAVAAQKSWLNVFTIVMTTKDTWTTLSLSPLANGSGCCKFPDQKTSQQQRRFPSTSCRLATYIVVLYLLLDIHNSYICDLQEWRNTFISSPSSNDETWLWPLCTATKNTKSAPFRQTPY